MTIDIIPSPKRGLLDSSPPNISKKRKKSYQPKIDHFFSQSLLKLNLFDYDKDNDTDEKEDSYSMQILNELRKEKGIDEPNEEKENILPPQKPETLIKLIPEISRVLPKTPLPISRKSKKEVISTEEQLGKLINILTYPLLLEIKYRPPSPYAISNFCRREVKDEYISLPLDDTLEEEEFEPSLIKAWHLVNYMNDFEDFKPTFTSNAHYSNMMSRMLTITGYNLAKENELIFQANFKHLSQYVRTRAFNLLQTIQSLSPDQNLKLTYKCPECPFRTESKLVLADHSTKPHLAFKTCTKQGEEVFEYYYVCRYCPTTDLKSANDITYHMGRNHPGYNTYNNYNTPTMEKIPSKYSCSSCSYEVNTKRYYDKHMEKCVVTIGFNDAYGLLSPQRNYHAYSPCKFEADRRGRPDLSKFYSNIEYSVKVESSANSSLKFPMEPYDPVLGLNTLLDKVVSKVKELSSKRNEEMQENGKRDIKANAPEVVHLKEIQNIEKSICTIADKDYDDSWMKPKGPLIKRQKLF